MATFAPGEKRSQKAQLNHIRSLQRQAESDDEIQKQTHGAGANNLINLQQAIGNREVQRLMRMESERIQRDDDEDDKVKLPQVDMGPKSKGRAYMLDWDSKHSEIHRLKQNETLREIYERNLILQIEQFFNADLSECYTDLDTYREKITALITKAEDEGKSVEAARLEANLNKAILFAVVKTLDVENSSRYQPVTGGPTYCNIYTYDVVSAMGGYLPRVWWTDAAIADLKQSKQVQPQYGKTIGEMNANMLTTWMATYGEDFGWTKATDMSAAQKSANDGELVILLAANKQASSSGHVTVMMPETEGHSATRKDEQVTIPMQSQAGRNNKEYGTTGSWWNDSSHKDGDAWIFTGKKQSPLLPPEQVAPELQPK